MGLSGVKLKEYIESVKIDADIEPFLYSPVSVLSTGMKTRFLLSLLGSVKPEILVMDEWIGTTDIRFIDEKQSDLNNLVNSSEIFVLASHNRALIEKYCNKVLLLDSGKLIFAGEVEKGYDLFDHVNSRT